MIRSLRFLRTSFVLAAARASRRQRLAWTAAGIALAGAVVLATLQGPDAQSAAPAIEVRPAMAVAVTSLAQFAMPIRIVASGDVAAWQEASIGAEAGGLRLAAVHADVGDTVRRGQVLAEFAADTVVAELAQARAASAESEAALAQAQANARRARLLEGSGTMAAQEIDSVIAAERMALARRDVARAAQALQAARLAQTRVRAPDDGVISARTATLGAVAGNGVELFRLIRGGRLEWRAELPAADLARLRPGQPVSVTAESGETASGVLRMVAPAIDSRTRSGIAYVDLHSGALRAGGFARGSFALGTRVVRTLPDSAVMVREGFSYVMRVDESSRARLTKVTAGRRGGGRIEILQGLADDDRVVLAGAPLLSDGDRVTVGSAPAGIGLEGEPR